MRLKTYVPKPGFKKTCFFFHPGSQVAQVGLSYHYSWGWTWTLIFLPLIPRSTGVQPLPLDWFVVCFLFWQGLPISETNLELYANTASVSQVQELPSTAPYPIHSSKKCGCLSLYAESHMIGELPPKNCPLASTFTPIHIKQLNLKKRVKFLRILIWDNSIYSCQFNPSRPYFVTYTRSAVGNFVEWIDWKNTSKFHPFYENQILFFPLSRIYWRYDRQQKHPNTALKDAHTRIPWT